MKKTLVALAAFVLIVAGVAYWAYYSLDVIDKFALEYYGSGIAGVPVHVGHVAISPRNGRGSVTGVEIGNPPGFSTVHAAKLGEIRVAADSATLTDRIVHVSEVAIEAPVIVYERGDNGTNLDAIQKNIEDYVARSFPVPEAMHKFVIDRLSIRGAKVTMTNPALPGKTFDLPDIELRDLGRREKGLTAGQVANVLASTVISRIDLASR